MISADGTFMSISALLVFQRIMQFFKCSKAMIISLPYLHPFDPTYLSASGTF